MSVASGFSLIDVSGDPWIGKTALLSNISASATEAGWTVASGAAGPLPDDLLFATFTDALDELLTAGAGGLVRDVAASHTRWLAGIFPALAAYSTEPMVPTSPSEFHHAFHAIRCLLNSIGAAHRLMLVIDDAHWVDDASRDLITHLLRHPPSTEVMLVLAYRPRQIPWKLLALLREYDTAGRSIRIELAPLNGEDLFPLPPASSGRFDSQALNLASGGDPGSYHRLGLLDGPQEESDIEDSRLPPETEAACLRDFRNLSPLGWSVVQSAALLHEPIDTAILIEVARMSETEVRVGIDELIACDLLRLDDARRTFRFRNHLIRATAYQSAGACWRLGAHARAAATLSRRQAPTPQIAKQLMLGPHTDDVDTARVLVDAAQACLWHRPKRAAGFAQAAINVEDCVDKSERHLLLATALVLNGQLVASLPVLDRVGQASPEAHAEAVLWRTRVLRLFGRHGQAREQLTETLRGISFDGDLRTRLWAALLAATLEVDAVSDAAEKARSGPTERIDDPLLQALVRTLLGSVDLMIGRTKQAKLCVREAVGLVDCLPNDVIVKELDCLYWISQLETALGMVEQALGHYERGLALAQQQHLHYVVPQSATALGFLLLRRGDVGGARHHADQAERTARRIGSEFEINRALSLRAQLSRFHGASTDETWSVPQQALPQASMAKGAKLDQLSGREYEISVLVSAGRTNQQIARLLGLSHKTVETYLARIFKKLSICSRAQLAALVGRSQSNSLLSTRTAGLVPARLSESGHVVG